jgi:hypothetical protein
VRPTTVEKDSRVKFEVPTTTPTVVEKETKDLTNASEKT